MLKTTISFKHAEALAEAMRKEFKTGFMLVEHSHGIRLVEKDQLVFVNENAVKSFIKAFELGVKATQD